MRFDPFCGFTAQPINAAYYMPGVYNGGYSHEPYGQNAYIDSAYGDVQQYPYYGGYSYTPYYANGQAYHNQAYQPSSQAYPGAYGPYPGASGAYRPYPQPQPSPPRRSRTAPSRAVPPTVRTTATSRKSRGLSADPFEKRFKAFSGPTKKPSPVYRKSRDPYNYRIAQYQAPTTLRRLRPFYAPSYTTYPPSTMLRTDKKLDTKRYPLYARVAVKAAELILGAAILGLVLGPMRGTSFHDFVIRTNTEWQAYLLASCLEAYYAACYPPNGPRINLVCHRAEWIIATILCFINTALYVLDFALSWLSGVTML
ncbi:hypothetical protein ANCCAN_02550 [Ancylostoma caninum]|uniref:Uncharacterized protein n=1 Tax=Ancylostoma caninum TaxID=29170 RepID=A0A368H7W5_ANCCA|nr:hypothetical protein ANCCAN_02550 [Ancylostoma caninum]